MGPPQNERRPVCFLVTFGFCPCCGNRNWYLDRIIIACNKGSGSLRHAARRRADFHPFY